MRKYPFTPSLLDSLPEELAELFRSLELTLLSGICSRLNLADQLNEVTVQHIRALRAQGVDLDEIKKAIQQETGIGEEKLDELISDVVARNQSYYTGLIDFAGLTQPEFLVGEAEIDAIRRQTLGEYRNLTRSMAFVVNGGRTTLAPAKAYQWALDNAVLQIESGTTGYNQAISSAVRQLADSGLRVVSYESGRTEQIDVAVRRAVMTGVSQICDKYTVQSAEYLGTHYFEVSAHSGARDKPGPSPWSSHKDWQGKVYSERAGDVYPSIFEVCGLGEVDGLEGANCKHRRFPFIPGVSERTYTDEELSHIDDGHDVTYDGKHYTAYEATQMQRRMENSIRKQKRRAIAFEKAGLKDEAQAASIKARRLTKKYKDFSKAAKLPEQRARMEVRYSDETADLKARAIKSAREEAAKQAALQNSKNTAILKERIASGEVSTTIRQQVQARHIEGTPQFEQYKAARLARGKTPQSILTVTVQEAQEIVDKYACTGTVTIKTPKNAPMEIREYRNLERVIGKYYANDAFHDTKRIMIVYAKKGVHIVPTIPKEEPHG